VVAAVDVFIQWFNFTKRMKMSQERLQARDEGERGLARAKDIDCANVSAKLPPRA
jgi:hypothetical protein